MTRSSPFWVLIAATVFCVSCASVAKNGMTVEQAQGASVLLAQGMTRNEVLDVLGMPTETEITSMGQKTDSPWQALAWNYRWPGKRLVLYFAKGDEWYLNNWSWHDF